MFVKRRCLEIPQEEISDKGVWGKGILLMRNLFWKGSPFRAPNELGGPFGESNDFYVISQNYTIKIEMVIDGENLIYIPF